VKASDFGFNVFSVLLSGKSSESNQCLAQIMATCFPKDKITVAIKQLVFAFLLMVIMSSSASAERKHAIAMLGEPALSDGFSSLPYANANAPKGGHIGYGVVGTFDNLNPFILRSMRTTARGVIDTSFGNFVFESLMQRSADEPFTVYGLLAETIETDEARTWAEFHINPAAKWSDGQPVTPEDVIFTYETFTAKARPPYSKRMEKIAKIEKTGDRSVKFTFNEKSDREFALIIALTPIIPKHATADAFDEPTLTTMIGSGPYLIDKVAPGTRITFRKNPNYWGKDLPIKKGLDNFETISIDYFKEDNAQFEAFKKGLFDVLPEGDPAKWGKNYDFPAVIEGKVKKNSFVAGTPANMYGFVFNTRKAVFADHKVRLALSLLYDFEWTNDNLFAGKYARTGSYWQNSELSALGKPASEAEKSLLQPYLSKISADIINGTWQQRKTDGSGRDRKTFLLAINLLKEAGYQITNRKMVDASGQSLAFEILCANSSEEKIALIYQRALAKVGIETQIRSVEDAQYQQRRQVWDYDMILATYSASLSPGIEQLNRWGSGSRDVTGTFNYAGVAEPAIDAMIAAMGRAQTREDFVDAVRALDRLLISGQYMIPLHHLGEQWLASWDRVEYPQKTALFGYQLPTWWAKQ
jgi:peptide/nickel transport system substrate-binding protein